MPEEVQKEDVKEEKKKGPFGKLKEKVEDSEEHLAILSTVVRLGILFGLVVFSPLTMLPFLIFHKENRSNFYASVFTGVSRLGSRLQRTRMVTVVVPLQVV